MRRILLVFCLLMSVLSTAAQNTVRQQIDKERSGSFLDVKTYEKARNFIRRDSTYYLGYMLEGAYLFFRANDELGFTKAAVPLQKALDKIEKDYDAILKIRTNNFAVYNSNYRYQFDYGMIAYFLDRCYQNLELENKSMTVLQHVRDRNFQVEINMDSYNTMAWLYQRNRTFTSKRFSFLKNSVSENVAAANRCLDSALQKIQNDFPVNNGLYDPKFLNRQYLSTYHYKAMIYDYRLNIDSANYYYNILIANHAFSSNNYAEFKMAMGEFGDADLFFREAENQDASAEKKTKEYFYMRGSLATYRGHPETADTLLTDVMQRQGSTPGYGWHSIGLARAQHFEGLTAESQDRANKASRFQELHIGTTWGQDQYNLAVASLNYLNQIQFKKEHWFEHDEWYFWLNPLNWFRWVKYTLEIRHHKMILASLVAENPEREQVIYAIFSSENLITFDEVWSVIDGFGNDYFIKVYERLLQTDKRPRVKKYFRYFLGKLYAAEGKEEKARKYFREVLDDAGIDDPYQTLLVARVYEGLALVNDGKARQDELLQMYELYPKLIPFSDLTMSFRLQLGGNVTEQDDKIVKDLRRSRIDFTNDSNAPVVTLAFNRQGKALSIDYQVFLGRQVFRKGTLRVTDSNSDQAGKLLAYRIFGIYKTKIGDEPPPVPQAKPDNKIKADSVKRTV